MPSIIVLNKLSHERKYVATKIASKKKAVDFVKEKGMLNQWTSLPDPNMKSSQWLFL